MTEEILINVTPSEARVAVVENGMLQEVYLDRGGKEGYLGNIYKGRVSRVLPGMQAAFVDIGLQRTAFLHASDMVRGRVHGLDQAEPPEPLIDELLREGEEIVVQIIKDPIGTKGARLTTNISVPSRYLVLLPEVDAVGISVRIEDEEERDRLRHLVESLKPAGGRHGYIVRTNAEGLTNGALVSDMQYLDKVWAQIKRRQSKAASGGLIYEDLSLPLRALRDLVHPGVEKIRIDHEGMLAIATRFVAQFIPDWPGRVEGYSGIRPIFDVYGVEDEIQRALERQSPLKSGGHLVIDQTEAMTTIDVNTGGYVGHRNLEETIYKTNLEAAQAIARQLRLRNLGGIIIIDFIDMEDDEHKRQVMKTLERALERDHAKTSVGELSMLGLVEMTRKRSTESLGQRLCEPCPTCSGKGHVKTAETVAKEVFREIMRSSRQFEASKLRVLASPNVVDSILEDQSVTVAELEELVGKTIRFQAEPQYNQEQFDVVLL